MLEIRLEQAVKLTKEAIESIAAEIEKIESRAVRDADLHQLKELRKEYECFYSILDILILYS